MEAIRHDYAPKGVRFFYVYKALAHPERDGYVKAFTLEERLMHVAEAKRILGTKFTWICDAMGNDLKHAFGDMANSEFVLDPEGRVVRKRAWSQPAELRADLQELVGPVENPTDPSDLDLETPPLSPRAPKGVVPRIEVSGRTVALKIEPVKEKDSLPLYVKLRAEVDQDFFEANKGKLYLGFHLDPLYRVHWNNRVEPLRFELDLPEGVVVSARTGVGPKVEEPADSDPREFLLDIGAQEVSAPLALTVHYVACDDAQTFCVPVTQRYKIRLERDPDGGRARGRGMGGRGGRGRGRFLSRLLERDEDGDGKLSRDEAPERFLERFDRVDTNKDGFVDREELEAMAARRGARARGGR